MPKSGLCREYLLAAILSLARVLLSCGVKSGSKTSQRTKTFPPPRRQLVVVRGLPRVGSGTIKTGCKIRSLLAVPAWQVLDPSNAHMGISDNPFIGPSKILVLERNFLVGFCPSIQMYSAAAFISCLLQQSKF